MTPFLSSMETVLSSYMAILEWLVALNDAKTQRMRLWPQPIVDITLGRVNPGITGLPVPAFPQTWQHSQAASMPWKI